MASFPRPPGMGETGIFTPGVGGCGAELKRFQALQGCNKRAADQEMKRGALLVNGDTVEKSRIVRAGDTLTLQPAEVTAPSDWQLASRARLHIPLSLWYESITGCQFSYLSIILTSAGAP